MSPQQPPKKRFRYTEPPIWARSVRSKNAQVGNRGPSKVNGKQPAPGFPSQAAPSPLIKTEVNGDRHAAPAAVNAGPGANAGEPDPSLILGPWERSITGQKPVETMTRLAADFLFSNVVARGDLGELASRGVLIEIEAKLGQLIDKGTNVRYWQPIMSECVVETGRYMFRSSMTEVRHIFQ
jgi:polynucleotide 5'-triphosphatase